MSMSLLLDLKVCWWWITLAKGPSMVACVWQRMLPSKNVPLARAMTFKNAAAGLPMVAAKQFLSVTRKCPCSQKEKLIRGFACALKEVEQYIFAPDMGTNEECMAWVKDEIDRVVGLAA